MWYFDIKKIKGNLSHIEDIIKNKFEIVCEKCVIGEIATKPCAENHNTFI